MFRLLIIDDEFITRKGIIKNIDYSNYNIQEIQEADDGVNALKIAKDYQPDIVISDIKMPRMDGVTFAFELKKILPNCRIILMSAYTELDYYRNAIKLNAVSYIEKPIDLEELKQSIKNAVDDLMQYTQYETMSKQVDELIKTNKEVLKSQLSTMIIDNNRNISHVIQKGNELGLQLDSEHYYLTVIIKQYIEDRLDPYDQGISKQRITSILEKYLQPLQINYVMHFKGNIAVITLIVERQHRLVLNYDKLEIVFTEIYKELLEICQPAISLGKVVSGINEVYDSYVSAVIAKEKLFFKKGISINHYKTSEEDKSLDMDNTLFNRFDKYLETSSKIDCILFIKHLTEKIRRYNNTPKNIIIDIYARLFTIINQYLHNMNNLDDINNDIHFNDISKMITLDALESYMIDNIDCYFLILKEQSEAGSIAVRVKKIIHDSYGDSNLSLEVISNHLQVSKNYLSAVFKKETSMTINKYITKYRIEKAKTKLRDTSYRIEIVANLVGYDDSDYFSKVFKKYVLCTPREYRKKFIK
ncbi:hypothetical protein SH1V18_40400 [Vallitalea longa]|uniref:Stage 0 sporulation protein A homolog n=1 Tax=Vallitalea longa TaxID=2936439 RepID=A0A9W6DGE8_9FIRM|nr:response regulator [Vallitalea longa]GKX31560.1 hypothetical protein SH1V18_40400 [Vallitalea longa]